MLILLFHIYGEIAVMLDVRVGLMILGIVKHVQDVMENVVAVKEEEITACLVIGMVAIGIYMEMTV